MAELTEQGMSSYTVSQDVLLRLLEELRGPHPDPWRPSSGGTEGPQPVPWRGQLSDLIRQDALSQLHALEQLKAALPREQQAQIEQQMQRSISAFLDEIPPRPPGWIGPWPPPNWKRNIADLVTLAAGLLHSELPGLQNLGRDVLPKILQGRT